MFAAAFFAYGCFFQGGGWGQNARFAMVRAIVEEGHYWIDHYLIYRRAGTADAGTLLVRMPITDAMFEIDGVTNALAWTGATVQDGPINLLAPPDAKLVPVDTVAVTGDLAFGRAHFHPNKGPGTSLIAVLPYFVIYRLERLFGANPDEWWTLTCNAWLTTVFSVGLISALGCVLVFRLALTFSAGKTLPSLLTAIAFGFGTMFFPLSGILLDANVAAVLLLASFYLLCGVKEEAQQIEPVGATTANRLGWRISLSGLCAGYAAITNYVAAVAVIALGVYLVWRVRRKNAWKRFAAGVAVPLLLICAYNLACFGEAFVTNVRYENPMFRHGSSTNLGTLAAPQWDVLLTILFSPFRGLFFSAPILLAGVCGLWSLFRDPRWRAEACLFAFLVGLYLWVNAGFLGWYGGWSAGPRYLGPALPFLAAPMVLGFIRFPRTTCALAAVSVMVNLLFAAVDPQVPVDFDTSGPVSARTQWRRNPFSEYTLPMFLTGRAGPYLDRQWERTARTYAAGLDAKNAPPEGRSRLLGAKRRDWETAIQARKELGSNGPVSGNPAGVYEAGLHRLFPAGSLQTEWNSFNVGEFVFPGRRLSLLLFAIVCGGLLSYALACASRASRKTGSVT